MPRFMLAPLLVLCLSSPGFADEFSDTLESALQAYKGGDMKTTGEDLAYANKLLTSQRAETLAKFLPAAPAGWEREDSAPEDSGAGMAMFGGGATVSASYTKGDSSAEVNIIADSPLVASMGAALRMAQSYEGKPFRVQRVEFADMDGEMQGIVNDRILVSVSGDASADDKKALIEAMDLAGLGGS